MKQKKNRLFALLYSLENVNYVSSFRFSRVTPDYILLYCDRSRINPPVGKALEIKEHQLNELSKMDESWLFDCGISLMAESLAANKKEGLEKLSDMVDRLEEELEAQSAKKG